MKLLRYFIAAVLVLGLTNVANAITFKVLDPSGSQPGYPSLPPIDMTGPNVFSFYTCSVFPSEEGCFGAYNDSPNVITSFSATITANPGVSLGTPDCPTVNNVGGEPGSAFTANITCSLSGDLTTGETLTVLFTGGSVDPGSSIWIVDSDIDPGDFGPNAGSFSVATTPEPSSLLLALSGMGPLGYLIRRRRKSI